MSCRREDREKLIKEIIDREWDQFHRVQNRGGRAWCQDEEQLFRLMRNSQFLCWPTDILESYRGDIAIAEAERRNLLAEKYAFMMADTHPDEFAEISDYLPAIDEVRRRRIEETVAIHVRWAQEFAKLYPSVAQRGRPIMQTDAREGETSIEVYQRGELLSYGEQTERLYNEFTEQCAREGINLSVQMRKNIVRGSGHGDLEEM